MRIHINTDPYDEGVPMFPHEMVPLNPGLTFMVGCNGSGKSSFLDCIKESWNNENIGAILEFKFSGDAHSTGEAAGAQFMEFVQEVYSTIKSKECPKNVLAIAKLTNYGLTPDSIVKSKNFLDARVIPDAQVSSVDLYFLVEAIDFESLLDQQSMDVQTYNILRFNNYTGYKKFIMNSRKAKDNRYAAIEKLKEGQS